MPRLKDAATTAKNWVGGMQTASQAYKDGIQNVEGNPLEKAAAASDAYIRGCTDGNAKRAAKLRDYGLENWKKAAMDKGAARLGSGATASQARYQQTMGRLLPHIQSVRDALPPRGTFDQNLARMDAFARGMRRFRETY